MAKTKESTALEACTRDTLLGNKISVRMLEYFSTVKHHPEGFEQLAREFLDICRILFSIEAGLEDCSKTGRRFPPDMVVELERKFRATHSDFQELDRMIHKFLEYENKGTVGRLQKGFRNMFPSHDIPRMRESLSKSREALRMSALVFQWSLGDDRIENSVGIGYTGLAAALDRMHGNRPALSSSNTSSTAANGTTGAASENSAVASTGSSSAAINTQASSTLSNDVNQLIANSNSISPARGGALPSPTTRHQNGGQAVESSLLDAGITTNGNDYTARNSSLVNINAHSHHGHHGHTNGHANVHANGQRNGHGRPLHDDSNPLPSLPPMLPTPQFLTERDSGREINLSDELRLIPDLQRSPSTSNHTAHSSRDIVGTAITTSGPVASVNSRSRITSTIGGASSLSQVTTDSRQTSHAVTANTLLSDNLEVMSIGASTAADSDSHAHGLAPPTAIKVVRLKADPASMPKWTPRNTVGANAANLKTALLSAVQGANYTLIEQLLDRGVSPDGGVLHEAVLHHDVESIRLLLLFGADGNGPDKNGVTPLFAAVDESFAEGANLLLKYGADPNRDSVNPHKDTSESPLLAAFATGKIGLAQLLLAYGGDPNHRVQRTGGSSSDSDGNGDNSTTLLLGAIGKKKPRRLVDLLLAYGADPNAKDGRGTSPLFTAVQAGRADLVAALLEHGADANRPGPKHVLWPATYHPACLAPLLAHGADLRKAPGILELASSLNKLETVRVLLKAGVDPNAKKDGVYTPLCTAIRDDHVDIFHLLLASGADPNLMASEYPAWKCITHNRVHLLPALVRAGADLHAPPGIAEMAVQVGNAEGLVWLLEHGGVAPDERNGKGHTPLTTALRMNRADLVQLLLDRGADPAARGEDWPLVLAVRHPPLLARLLPHVQSAPPKGSDPHHPHPHHQPHHRIVRGVLERAVAAGELESVQMLLAAGVSVEDKTGGVFSPLTTAIREGRRNLVEYLLDEAGADPNAPGEHLPLVKALRRGHNDADGGAPILRWLLAKGADINKTYRGWNAVMQVLEDGNLELLTLLVEHTGDGGAVVDLDAADDEGRTVREMAAERGWPEGEAFLLAHALKKED